jgi:hypothetical protein
MIFWLFSYIIIAWKYSTSHVNWIIKFRNQIISLTINVCFVYSILQINNVTIDWRFENQLIISLFTLNAYFEIDRLIFWYFVQFEFI